MLRQPGRVVESRNGAVWVDCDTDPGCARCAAGRGCGAGLSVWSLGARRRRVPARNPFHLPLSRGDRVTLAVPAAALLTGAVIAYVVPLAGLVAGAGFGTSFGGETGAIAGAVAGLAGGIAVARWLAARAASRLEPHITCAND